MPRGDRAAKELFDGEIVELLCHAVGRFVGRDGGAILPATGGVAEEISPWIGGLIHDRQQRTVGDGVRARRGDWRYG